MPRRPKPPRYATLRVGVAQHTVGRFPWEKTDPVKKQGVLPLTFTDAADCDRIREDDRLSLLDLANLTPRQPVTCRVAHADGGEETLSLAHSFTADQLTWFHAGSALNAMRAAA